MYLLGPHDPCHLELAVESVTIRADQQALLQCMLIQIDHCAPVCSVRMSHSRRRCSAFCAGRRMLLLRAFVKYAPDTSATEGSVARKNSSVACCEQGATRRQQCAASLNRHLHHCACFLGKVQTLSARTLMSMPHIPQPASSIFVLTVPVVRKMVRYLARLLGHPARAACMICRCPLATWVQGVGCHFRPGLQQPSTELRIEHHHREFA